MPQPSIKPNRQLIIKNLSKCYNYDFLWQGADLKINFGEIALLEGQNGSGKSTLLNILSGITDFDSGEILIDNKKQNESSLKKVTHYLPSKLPLYEDLTLFENSIFFLTLLKKKLDKKLWLEILDLWQIAKYNDYQARFLSSGTRQKLGLIWLFLADKDINLLDEPLNTLDSNAIKIFYQQLNITLFKKRTFIIAAHSWKNKRIIDKNWLIENRKIKNV